jgi:hypothetical protein
MAPDMKKVAFYIAVAAVIVIALVVLVRCTGSRGDQAKQNNASSEAFTNAVEVGVATVENRTATDREIDRATAVAMLEIDNAANTDDVRNAVVASLCGRQEYRNDPACGL